MKPTPVLPSHFLFLRAHFCSHTSHMKNPFIADPECILSLGRVYVCFQYVVDSSLAAGIYLFLRNMVKGLKVT